jgi:hypothetical protein
MSLAPCFEAVSFCLRLARGTTRQDITHCDISVGHPHQPRHPTVVTKAKMLIDPSLMVTFQTLLGKG